MHDQLPYRFICYKKTKQTSVLKIIILKKGVDIQAIKSCETSYLYVVIANSITT